MRHNKSLVKSADSMNLLRVTLAILSVSTNASIAQQLRDNYRNLKRFDTGKMWPIEVSSFYGFDSKYPRSYIPNPLTSRVKKSFHDPSVFRSNYEPYFVHRSQRVLPWGSHSRAKPSLWRRNGNRRTNLKVESRQEFASQAGIE